MSQESNEAIAELRVLRNTLQAGTFTDPSAFPFEVVEHAVDILERVIKLKVWHKQCSSNAFLAHVSSAWLAFLVHVPLSLASLKQSG